MSGAAGAAGGRWRPAVPPGCSAAAHEGHLRGHHRGEQHVGAQRQPGHRQEGFDHSRQNNVNDATNIERFKAFYGLEPTTLVPAFTDVKNKFPEATFHHLLITMNWLTLYDKYLVLSGRWGYHPATIGPLVWRYARMIQSFLNDKVGLHHVDMDTAIPLSLDTTTFTVNEIRTCHKQLSSDIGKTNIHLD